MDCAILVCKNGCEVNDDFNWYIDENDHVIIQNNRRRK